MPRPMQTRDWSADGNGSIWHDILTTSQLPRGVARRKWRFADTNPMRLAQSQEKQKVNTPYDRTAHADANSKLHFVFHSHPYRGDVFGCIRLQVVSSKDLRGTEGTHDNGEDNKSDECLRYIKPVCCLLDRRDH
jgi:hypothetical protein